MANFGEWIQTRRGMIIAGSVVFVVAAGYLYYRQKKSAATASASTSGSSSAGNLSNAPTGAAYPMPSSGGDVFINNPNPFQPPVNIPTALAQLQQGNYIVKGVNSHNGMSDQFAGGVAQIVYGLADDDAINIAADGMTITLLNPGAGPQPWPVGSSISYPVNPEKLAPPSAQVSSTTLVGNTSANGSASGG